MTRRWPRPDFLATRARAPVLAWVWAATGVLALTAAVGEGLAAQRRVDVETKRFASATQRLPRSAPASPRAPADGKADADAARAAQRVAALLAHPWGQILSSIEAETPAGLQWQSFEHASDSPELRFEGMAPDAATALQVVDMLSARAGWSGVVLTRLQAPEARDAAAPGGRWRFEIQAAVDARRIAAGGGHADR